VQNKFQLTNTDKTVWTTKVWLKDNTCLGLGTQLFVKLPRTNDSEVTFLVFRVKLLPVTTSLTTQR